MQMFAIVVSFALTVAAVAMLVPAVRRMLGVIRSGQADASRSENPSGRALTMLKETFLHTRMLQWHWVGIMHWFVYAAFLFLSTAVLAAYFQLFSPSFAWPLIGHWYPYEWFSELIGLLSTVGIVYLIVYRQKHHPRSEGRRSRFFGSTFWQAYFVEALALLEGGAILFVRAAEWKLDEDAGRSHYPIASWIGDAFYSNDPGTLENVIYAIAAFKIALAMIWLMVIARNITMGIAWHRFTAWFNIYFKREADGSTALGAMKPLTSAGKPVTLDDIDDLDEDSVLGVGRAEDFSWKGILDFTTCTECGRCQSQCPAWNTEKPLSPKLLITALRDHAYAKHDGVEGHADRALVGSGTKGESAGSGTDVLDYFYNPADGDFVIDEDVLWSCTSCGACVQQCPVDIEHVDHIMDMRRYQLLVESNFPAELNQLFKGLENKGNPWNMSASARMDWAKGLEFDVPVVGEDLESLESVDWLFWVGCAGAYEDRAKKTTRAVAELLDMAGISFGVLGNGETCTGDPARRAGNEFVFQGLAQQNVETFKEYKVKKVVSTCAHCFNTLKNEYKDFGIELEVVHHTQLLNRLVREGKLTPVKDGAGAAKRSITYHDPCYLGRHNQVYSPPRELLEILPGAEFVEMERNSERSFCCGAGGARMWMEENLGERINMNRTREAVGTGADQIAVGCPFCRVMLSDGLTSQQASGEAREEVEVLDVAQMLLASVKGEQATKAAPSAAPAAAAAAPAAAPAAAAASSGDVATKDEPEAGDVTVTEDTVTETADAGPAAKASGGTSLFDTPAPDAEPASAPADPGGSLFDLGGSESEGAPAAEAPEDKAPEEPAAEEKPAATADLGSGGSLFDVGSPEPEPDPAPAAEAESPQAESPQAESPQAEAPAAPEEPTATDLGTGGSLFDIAAPEPTETPTAAAEPAPEPEPSVDVESPSDSTPSEQPAPAPQADLGSGSLFDIEAPEPAAAAAAPEQSEPAVDVESPSDSAVAETAEDDAGKDAEAATSDVADEADAPAPSRTTSTPATDVDLTSVGSLFDIEAPVAVESPSDSTPSKPQAEAPEEVESPSDSTPSKPEPEAPEEVESPSDSTPSKPEPEAPEEVESPSDSTPSEEPAAAPSAPPSGADLSRAALFAGPHEAPASDESPEPEAPATAVDEAAPESEAQVEDPDTILDSDDDRAAGDDVPDADEDDETTDAKPTEEEPAKPAADGTGHTPRTDADISGSGSLFDL
ncbi:heterodisulfide reductase-related iron-sulfur binding cluster [Nocardioides baculatus]|uniref:4Fe-4S dicluster domain-containing protein n=1 Tax=Nocardioides baculatus TaxID=2801337 RepID=A0ABS1L8N3_9ACTN|nr:heterodisulfide reductase-related iron-sulfur binding cluster [Nocardioides baculatus]MBL0746901.1 4Fe-4S dicluster domain-containing protein [Nocardioides baculatus]